MKPMNITISSDRDEMVEDWLFLKPKDIRYTKDCTKIVAGIKADVSFDFKTEQYVVSLYPHK